jgi:hypothetical protein
MTENEKCCIMPDVECVVQYERAIYVNEMRDKACFLFSSHLVHCPSSTRSHPCFLLFDYRQYSTE